MAEGDPKTDDVSASLTRLHQYQIEQSEVIRRLLRISTALSVAVGVVMVLFIWLIVSTLGNNFSGQRVVNSLQKHVPEMLPTVLDGAMQVATRVYPTYQEHIEKEAIDAIPEVSAVVQIELDKFLTGLESKGNSRLKQALVSSFTGQDKPLRKAFPRLTDQDVTRVLSHTTTALEQDLLEIANEFMLRYMGEIINLQQTIAKFDTSGLPSNEAELSRLLIHHMLQLLDAELMEAK